MREIQDLRNFRGRVLCEMENSKKTQVFWTHNLTGYATKEHAA